MSFIVILAKIQPKEGCHDSILELSEELIYESSDLIYHLLVLLVNQGVSLGDVYEELNKRK